MSTGLVAVDVAISAPAAGQYNSAADQSLSIGYNPAFLYGSGSQSQNNAANPSAGATADQSPGQSLPSSAVAAQGGTPGVSVPASQLPGTATTTTLSSSLLLWLVIGGALFLVLGGGDGGRRR